MRNLNQYFWKFTSLFMDIQWIFYRKITILYSKFDKFLEIFWFIHTLFFKRNATFLDPFFPVTLGHWPWPRVMYTLLIRPLAKWRTLQSSSIYTLLKKKRYFPCCVSFEGECNCITFFWTGPTPGFNTKIWPVDLHNTYFFHWGNKKILVFNHGYSPSNVYALHKLLPVMNSKCFMYICSRRRSFYTCKMS